MTGKDLILLQDLRDWRFNLSIYFEPGFWARIDEDIKQAEAGHTYWLIDWNRGPDVDMVFLCTPCMDGNHLGCLDLIYDHNGCDCRPEYLHVKEST